MDRTWSASCATVAVPTRDQFSSRNRSLKRAKAPLAHLDDSYFCFCITFAYKDMPVRAGRNFCPAAEALLFFPWRDPPIREDTRTVTPCNTFRRFFFLVSLFVRGFVQLPAVYEELVTSRRTLAVSPRFPELWALFFSALSISSQWIEPMCTVTLWTKISPIKASEVVPVCLSRRSRSFWVVFLGLLSTGQTDYVRSSVSVLSADSQILFGFLLLSTFGSAAPVSSPLPSWLYPTMKRHKAGMDSTTSWTMSLASK